MTDSSQQRRSLKAIMFTDIKGFTSMMEADEETAVGLVKTQRGVVRKYVAIHGGEERETIGDAFLVLFDSAVNAVRCAIDIQREIWEYNQTREEDKQVWIRIGVHLGDILIEEGSVFGEGVNLAARVEPLAEPGGICITRQVYDQVKNHLNIDIRHLPVHELKNITDVPDIYKIKLAYAAPTGPLAFLDTIRDYLFERYVIWGIAGFVALIFFGILAWYYLAEHITYARDVAYIRHIPTPTFEISRSEVNKLNNYFVITKRGARVVRMEEVSRPYIRPEDANEMWAFTLTKKGRPSFPIANYLYEKDKLKEVSYLDEFEVLQYKLIFNEGGRVATAHDRAGFIKTFENQISSFGFQFDEKGRITQMENRNAFGILRNDSQGVASYRYVYNDENLPIEVGTFDTNGNATENKDGVARTQYTYNANGMIDTETYYDRYKSIHEGTNGVAIVKREYDGQNRLVLEKYLDRSSQPIANNDGSCAKKVSYDESGLVVDITFLSCALTPKAVIKGYASLVFEYKEGLIFRESYRDEKGEWTVDNRGVATVEVTYDDNGRVASFSLFGLEHKPVSSEEGIHTVNYYYNDLGEPSRKVFLGVDDKPVISGFGYAEVKVQCNDRGDPTEWAYFDTEGNLTISRDGYAMMRNVYDQYGNIISKVFFDKYNEPVIGRGDACHKVNISYDDAGNLAETRCFDGSGNLTPGIRHCAISKYQYDNAGRLIHFECYVADGVLLDVPNLPSSSTIRYDKRGYISEVRAFDASGEPAERYQGAAIWRRVSDENGNQLEISTYDRNGHLINNPMYKAAIFRRKFDDKGHELLVQAFDPDGNPTVGVWGYAEIRYQYDDKGHKTSEAYFDEKGQPAANFKGVHEYRKIFDDTGHIKEVANIGIDDNPTLSVDGVAYIVNTYDQWGWLSTVEYLGVSRERAVNSRLGCAKEVLTKDDRGNVLEIKRYGVDGELCRNPDCEAIVTQSYDSKGKMVKQVFRDADGAPMEDDNGAAGYENEYDAVGRLGMQHVVTKDGKDGADKEGVHQYKINYNPSSGLLWFISYYDKDGEPSKSKTGGILRLILYDPVYLERQRAKVDVGPNGNTTDIKCLDNAGNEIERDDCVTQADIKTEYEKVMKFMGKK